MLGYYAERQSSVEFNNTFYRIPKTEVLESWAAQVPDRFRFSIKASRRITHFKRLKEADEVTDYLLRGVAHLGDRLGLLLFQLPPNLKCDLERLDRFLELLPAGTRAAFEFRHPSWFDESVFDRLRARDLALVAVNSAEDESATNLVRTAPYVYLRLRRPDYDGAGPRMAADFVAATERLSELRRPAKVRRTAAVAQKTTG